MSIRFLRICCHKWSWLRATNLRCSSRAISGHSGTVTSAEPGQYAWNQVPVNFPSGLLVNPTSEVRELSAAERRDIWSHLPSRLGPPGHPLPHLVIGNLLRARAERDGNE